MFQKLELVLMFCFLGPNDSYYKRLKLEQRQELLDGDTPNPIGFFLESSVLLKVWQLTFDFYTPYDKILFLPKLIGCIIYTALYVAIWIILIISGIIIMCRFLEKFNEALWGKRK